MPLRISDVFRSSIVTVPELRSDGYGTNSIYLFANLISTTSGGVVTVDLTPSNDVSLLYDGDYQVNPGDILYLYDTQPGGIADGYYTINSVLSDNTLLVNEPLVDSTDGYSQFRYVSGASIVGLNSSGMTDVQGNTVQQGIQELDANKIDYFEHETLRQLIHFIDEGPADGFVSGAYKVISPVPSIFPTSVIWYTDNTMGYKIVEKTIIWSGVVPITITWQVYNTDGVTVAHTVSDSITYTNNIFETTRTRTIS